MEIELDLKLPIEQNAAVYYERAKKAKRKLEGAIKALNESKLELEKIEREKEKIISEIEKEIEQDDKEEERKQIRKSFWYDKFRWFFASNGMLVVGGRDATSNDIIIKKHMEKTDLVFHTESPGSPFFLLKTDGREIDPKVLEEVAVATAGFSRTWKLGFGNSEVFYVNPDQVSKEALSGEYMQKGAFMIRGKRNNIRVILNLAVGVLEDGRLMCGPVGSVSVHCKVYVTILQGDEKKSDFAKKIVHKIGGSLDEVMHILPSGEFRFG